MNNKQLGHYFLLALLFGSIVLTFFILRPFLYVIILAIMCAIVFHPLQQKILHMVRSQAFAALLTTIIVVVVIVVPFVLLGIKIFQEARDYYAFLVYSADKNTIIIVVREITHTIQQFIPLDQSFSIDINQYSKQGLAWLLNHLGFVFGSITKLVFHFFIFIIATYYALKDGPKLKKILIDLSPLENSDDENIFRKIKDTTSSVIKGSLAVACAQGLLATLGFILFGVPNPMLWGIAATLASLIPGIGTALVMIPAVLFIFFTKGTFLALGLLVWATILVGLIDNILGPIFIGQGIHVHPFIVFISVMGGIVFFGPIGFLLGPLSISLFFALLDTYVSSRKNM